MKNIALNPADLAPISAILALVSDTASEALARLVPDAASIGQALDRTYGRGGWSLCWDEDFGGKPIRGTIAVVYGAEQLIVG